MSWWRAVGGLVGSAVVVAVLWVDVPVASACSCAAPLTDQEAYERADAVFVGTVTERRRDERLWGSDLSVRLIFAVDAVYKGEVFERQSVVSAFGGAACGIERVGEERAAYLVFATTSADFVSGDPAPGELVANLCGGSRPVGGEELTIGEGTAPIEGRSPIGGAGWWPPTRTNAAILSVASLVAFATAVGVWSRRQT